MRGWLPVVVASAHAACTHVDPVEVPSCTLGDPDAPAQLEILHRDGDYVTTTPGSRVPITRGPQGGWLMYFGARATNLDGCKVDITTSFRDVVDGQLLKVDRRATILDDTGDGWGGTRASRIAVLPMCPQITATRDLYDQPYEVTVTLDDAYGQHASQSIVIVPTCPDPDVTGRCKCECDWAYAVGADCSGLPPELDEASRRSTARP